MPTDGTDVKMYLRTHGSLGVEKEVDDYSTWVFKTETSVVYDAHLNPVYKTRPINYPVIFHTMGLQFVPDNNEPTRYNISKINIKQIDKTSGAITYQENREYFYEYNTAGLPTVMRVKTDVPGSAVEYNKYVFIYE